MNETDLRTIELGHAYTRTELLNHFRAVWGGVSWPGRRPGFACVVGMGQKPHLDSYDCFLLDEYESFDMRKLVRQCGALDLKYGVSSLLDGYGAASGRWIGDFENDAASRFIQEMNDGRQRTNRDDTGTGRATFGLCPTPMLEMAHLYAYAVAQLKHLLAEKHRTLFIKESRIKNYLAEIEEAEIAELQRGDYPAIEALAFAVIELRDAEDERKDSFGQPYHYDFDPLDASRL